MVKELRIELTRESDAVEFERFVAELDLHPILSGALVPTRLPDGELRYARLRPEAGRCVFLRTRCRCADRCRRDAQARRSR